MNIKKILLTFILSIISFSVYAEGHYFTQGFASDACAAFKGSSCNYSLQASSGKCINDGQYHLYAYNGAGFRHCVGAAYKPNFCEIAAPSDGACQAGGACNVGDSATFAVLSSSSTQALVLNTGSIFNANFEGCVYDYGLSNSQSCYYEPSGSDNLYCIYQGQVTLEGSANVSGVTPTQTPDYTPPDNCLRNGKKVLCENSPENEGCGSISFEGQSKQEVCFNDEALGCVSYNDKGTNRQICAGGDKNCGLINGVYVCATDSDGSGVNSYQDMGCLADDQGNQHCITNREGVKQKSTITTIDNNDGTSTQTTTTSDNVVGSSEYSSTVTIDNTTNDQISSSTQGKAIDESSNVDLSPVTNALQQNGNKLDNVNTNLENAFQLLSVPSVIDSTAAITKLDNESQGLIDSLGTDQVGNTDFLSSVFAWPSGNCTTIPFVYSSSKFGLNLNYTLDPCTKLALFRSLFGWFLYITTAFFIFQLASRRTS